MAAGVVGGSVVAGTEALRHELVAAFGGPASDLSDWEQIAWDYGRSYAVTPPSVLLQQLAADLLVARQQYDRVTDDAQRGGMQRVIAQLAVFMALAVGDLGDYRSSHRWWRLARLTADSSQDTEVRVWARGREVVRGLYDHRPLENVLDLAAEAISVSAVAGMGTGSVLMGRAQALALQGRTVEAESALSDVYACAERLPARVTDDLGSMYGWPEYRMRHGESVVYTFLADNKRAEAAQNRALAP